MSLHRQMGAVTVFAVALGAASGAWAGPPTDQLRGAFAEVSRVLEDPATDGNLPERLTAIRRLVHQTFDFRRSAQLALGPAWATRSPAEQDEFARLFGTLLERAYILGIASRAGIGGAVNVNYVDEAADGDWVTVKTTVVSRDGGVTPYTYWMTKLNDRWAVCDVVIDGFSVVANYRSQFTRILQTASFSDLLQRMRAKVSEASDIWMASIDGAPRAASAVPPAAAVAPLPATSQTLVLQPAPRSAEPKVTPQQGAVAEPVTAAVSTAIASREALTRPVKTAVAALKSYWVQVGAFSSLNTAKRLAALLSEWKLPVHTAPPAVLDNGPADVPLSRVRIGPFPDRAQAEVALRELRNRGFTPFVADR